MVWKQIYIFFQKQFPKYNKKKLPHNGHTSQTLTLFFYYFPPPIHL